MRPQAHNLLSSRSSWLYEAQVGDAVQHPTRAHAETVASDNELGNFYQNTSPFATFQLVYQLMKEYYVDPIPSDAPLAHGASAALIASLDDPNSRFIEPNEYESLKQQDEGVYQGSGINFIVRKNVLRQKTKNTSELVSRDITVISVVPDSPAQKAGIKNGDVITEINEQWVRSYDLFSMNKDRLDKLADDPVTQEKEYIKLENQLNAGIALGNAQAKLNLTSSTPLVLSIHRAGVAAPIKVTLNVSQPTKLETVKSSIYPDGSGYIKIAAFNDLTSGEFSQALNKIGSTNKLMIDLRDCPGGQVQPLIDIANSFAPASCVGQIVLRDNQAKPIDASLGFGTRTYDLKAKPKEISQAKRYTGKLVGLVNNGSANMAEMLAVFLRDQVGARIVGTNTFGDGNAQTLYPMGDQSAFVLSTGAMKTDLGKKFNEQGIEPDIVVADGVTSEGADQVIAKAISALDLPPLRTQSAKTEANQEISL